MIAAPSATSTTAGPKVKRRNPRTTSQKEAAAANAFRMHLMQRPIWMFLSIAMHCFMNDISSSIRRTKRRPGQQS
jgi:hypothetical protein